MAWHDYSSLKIPIKKETNIKAKYSITSDILSYQLCSRQYGFFAVRGYQPAHVVQFWFGTVIHQVLDKLHLHYQGLLDENTKHQVPTDQDVVNYFNAVDDSLKARGIKAVNQSLRDTAINVLTLFNQVEGPKLYPQVLDTECDLQSDRGDFILHGVVDLLKEVSSAKYSKEYDKVEIWDYKGTKFPDLDSKYGEAKLNRYKYQMLVYAELYKLKNGRYPLKGVLYFMNELQGSEIPDETPPEATYVIEFRDKHNRESIDAALDSFAETVSEIECKREHDTWDAPKERPDNETCDICDLRWNCPVVKYRMRYP
jgi:putative RecB family exonuclease